MTSALSNLSFWVDPQINRCPVSTYGWATPKVRIDQTSALSNLSFWVDAQINRCPASTYGCGYPKNKA